jgi:hypothetical protein
MQTLGHFFEPLYSQGMLLLKAIPKKWDTIAQLYCNGMQMANITFVLNRKDSQTGD